MLKVRSALDRGLTANESSTSWQNKADEHTGEKCPGCADVMMLSLFA